MLWMSDGYNELLDATIRQLQDWKTQGVRFVPVSAEGVAALNGSAAAPRPAVSRPAPVSRAVAVPPAESPARSSRPEETPSYPLPEKSEPPFVGIYNFQAATTVGIPECSTVSAAAPVSTTKATAFAELRQRAMACVKCPNLASSRRNVVFGVGSIDAQLMFVGEAPGADEDEQGEPFVGKAGQLLTKIIQTMGLERGDVYIANILKCRPDTPGETAGNRKPTSAEMQTCIPYLHEQIDLIRPKVLVALGGTAVEGLLGATVGITKLRGNWQTYRGIPLMPTYHPAYLLRNQALAEKRRVWEDMLQAMEKLGMPISEKQRNFFVKG